MPCTSADVLLPTPTTATFTRSIMAGGYVTLGSVMCPRQHRKVSYKLPTIAELARQYNSSDNPIKRALWILDEAGRQGHARTRM